VRGGPADRRRPGWRRHGRTCVLLTGVRRLSATVHQIQNREYGEKQGDKGISPRRFWSRGKARNGPATKIGGSGCSYMFGKQLSITKRDKKRGWKAQGGSRPQHEARLPLDFDRATAYGKNYGGGSSSARGEIQTTTMAASRARWLHG
jgi:hypothetical protein